jgi:hypothetical protein
LSIIIFLERDNIFRPLNYSTLFWVIDFAIYTMIKKIMHLRSFRNFSAYFILLFYLCTPMLDSMVCEDCLGNAPFHGETAIRHSKALHTDVTYSPKSKTQSRTEGDETHKSFCPLCANFLLNVPMFSVRVHIPVAEWEPPDDVLPLSEFHHSIHKPPQNFLV